MAKEEVVVVKQIKSAVGRRKDQSATLKGLGIRRMHHSVELTLNDSIKGMLFKIQHLIKVEKK